jgi:DNA-binding IclR family transcriptional regulator
MEKSTIFRIVITLEHWGLLEKTRSQKYKLGTKFIYFGNLVIERQEIVSMAQPYLQKLTETVREATFLATLNSNLDMIFIAKAISKYSMQMRSTVGLPMPAQTTADGKLLLAFADPERLEKYFELHQLHSRTVYSIADKEKFLAALTEIRQKGYSIDNQEYEIGLFSVSAPIFNADGKALWSVSFVGPIYRVADNISNYIQEVIKTAAEISDALGYGKNSF